MLGFIKILVDSYKDIMRNRLYERSRNLSKYLQDTHTDDYSYRDSVIEYLKKHDIITVENVDGCEIYFMIGDNSYILSLYSNLININRIDSEQYIILSNCDVIDICYYNGLLEDGKIYLYDVFFKVLDKDCLLTTITKVFRLN